MREIFPPADNPPDPGRVFYTIRPEDVGRGMLDTEIGPILVRDFMGQIMKRDVGKRIYRVQDYSRTYWLWQVENEAQFKKRTEKGKDDE